MNVSASYSVRGNRSALPCVVTLYLLMFVFY